MPQIIRRRDILKGAVALSAISFVPAFAQSRALRMMFWGGQERADRTFSVADGFSEANGVTADGEFMQWADYWPKLATQVAGGNAPDILQMDYRFIVEYARRNTIAPLDEFIGNELELGDLDADQLDAGRVDGKLYGVSLGTNAAALVVNVTALEEAGLAVPKNGWSYEDLPSIGEALVGTGTSAIADSSGNETMLENWLRQRGKALYTADGMLGFDAADAADWFALWQGFRERGICVPAEVQASDTGSTETSLLVQRKAIMLPMSSNQLVGLAGSTPDRLTLVTCPIVPGGVGGGHYRKPSQYWSVSAASTDKAAAVAFISYFVNDLEAGEILGVERGIPASTVVREAVSANLDDINRLALDYVASLDGLLGPLPPAPPPAAGEIEVSILQTVSQEVAFQVRSPEDGGNELVRQAGELLARLSS